MLVENKANSARKSMEIM